ncbi:MAG TPA: helix-turn-helix domain-containing protein [Terriglobales bacterium]|nr:helix-turn-helix domain-containing protein [Terriglobales bacterium]
MPEIANGADGSHGSIDSLDPVWKALSDPTRRGILDFLRDRPRTTTEIVESFPNLSRFGVMKHIEVLREAQLVTTREQGRQRVNSLNVVPIRQIYERWVGPFQELWTGELLRIKELAESDAPRKTHSVTRRRKKQSH